MRKMKDGGMFYTKKELAKKLKVARVELGAYGVFVYKQYPTKAMKAIMRLQK